MMDLEQTTKSKFLFLLSSCIKLCDVFHVVVLCACI